LDTIELRNAIESLLLVSDQPLRVERLAEILEVDKALVSAQLQELVSAYRERNGGILLEEVAAGYQLRTPAASAEWIRRLGRSKPFRFSRAALETLAIIAYRQPLTRAEIEYLRGVDSGGVVRTLLERRLIRILGKKEIAGRPLVYGTSKEFLELFGLKTLADLPTLKEFSELDPDTPQLDAGDLLASVPAPAPASEPH